MERHIARGGDVILSNHRSFYFDMTYGQYPLSYTYDFDPGRYHIPPRSYDHVLGVEAEVWTEWIDKRPKLDLNVYPPYAGSGRGCLVGRREKKNTRTSKSDWRPLSLRWTPWESAML